MSKDESSIKLALILNWMEREVTCDDYVIAFYPSFHPEKTCVLFQTRGSFKQKREGGIRWWVVWAEDHFMYLNNFVLREIDRL